MASNTAGALAPSAAGAAGAALSTEQIEAALSQGAALADEGDARAVEVLSQAARASTSAIVSLGGQRFLLAPPEQMPASGALREATQQASRAHLAWGQAANRFARRDQAITALARAYRLAGPNRASTNRLSRDAANALGTVLREGLPQVAADDTLDTLSSLALWKPRRFSFELPPTALGPSSTVPGAGAASDSGASDAASATPRVELLITQGKVFPPESMTVGGEKNVVAPLYRTVASTALPPVLRLGYMVAGYEKQASGPNRGLWKLEARVFYPHPIFTRFNRDDRARAEALCAQFLRLRALQAAAFGVSNPYGSEGIPNDAATSLWMNEVSALWPSDDDDPETAEQRGARMPKANTQSPVVRPVEIVETPLSMPWVASGQVPSAPGDILFFKSGQPRAEVEWLREIAHEYGHVALAPAGRFRPPLEPFGNGHINETLAMMWLAASPQLFDASAFAPPAGLSPIAPGFAPFQAAPATRAVSASSSASPALGGASSLTGGAGPARNTNAGASAAGASAAGASAIATPAPLDNSVGAVRAAALAHVAREAVPALRLWSAQGPGSALRRDPGFNGLKYLQGFCVWAERVYGAPTLGAAMRPSIQRSARSWKLNARIMATTPDVLLADWETAVLLGLKGASRLPLWLPGALESLPQNVPAAQLANRSVLSLQTGESIATRLFIPLDARVLHLSVRGVPASAVAEALQVEGWRAREAAGGALEVELDKRSGWQRFVWRARAPLTIGAAWLSK